MRKSLISIEPETCAAGAGLSMRAVCLDGAIDAYVSILQHTSAYVSSIELCCMRIFFQKKRSVRLGDAIDVRDKVEHVSTSAVCKAVCKHVFFVQKQRRELCCALAL